MAAKNRFILASSLVALLLIVLFVFVFQAKKSYNENNIPEPQQKCLQSQRVECISAEGYKGFKICDNGKLSQCFAGSVGDCVLNQTQLSAVCCKDKDGKVYDCSEKKNFRQGDYVITKVNLQKALQQSGIGYSDYKACGFSDMSPVQTFTPKSYQHSTQFVDANVICSSVLYAKDYRDGTFTGLIPNVNGAFKLVEWRVYPSSAAISNPSDAKNQIGISKSIFSLEVNVGG